MSKNLAICMSRAITIYFLAWAREYGAGREFDLIVSNGETLPDKYINLLAENGITCVEKTFAQEQTYESLILQPYESFDSHRKLLDWFRFKKIVYFSDSLRNGMFSFPELDPRTTEIVYFGFELVESAFFENLTSSQQNISRSIVSVKNIGTTWNDLLGLYPESNSTPIMQKNELLIAMRHWGSVPQYTLKQDNLHEYLLEELESCEGLNRVIYRGHPWLSLDSDLSIRRNLSKYFVFSKNIEFVFWEDLFEPNGEFPELTSPEGEFWKSKHQLGQFFAFDGSLNTLVSLRCPETHIIYPNREVYKKYFEYEKSTNLVSEQVLWQRELSDQIKNSSELSGLCVTTSGKYYEKLIIQIARQERDVLTQERDVLTQERDVLTQERDVLTQERDVLTQERDVLTNSTIWRATKPVRRVVAWIKRKD
jgi:hypothetical protein